MRDRSTDPALGAETIPPRQRIEVFLEVWRQLEREAFQKHGSIISAYRSATSDLLQKLLLHAVAEALVEAPHLRLAGGADVAEAVKAAGK